MCQIGLTQGEQGPVWMLQLCLTPEHRTFSELLWELVRSCPLDSLATVALLVSRSPWMVGGDVSTTVTLTPSSTG